MNAANCSPIIERYFSELGSKMKSLPAAEREEILRELRAHVMDRLENAGPSEEQCQKVLVALGTPQEIARQYRLELALGRAAKSKSPAVLFRGTLLWAVSGLQGFVVFMVALFGYGMALAFFVGAVLKPFFPDHIGLYAGKDGVNIAYLPNPHGPDVLGNFFIPVALITGLLLMQGTSLLLRFLIGRFVRLKKQL
jgi:uncharacterized membrane protein